MSESYGALLPALFDGAATFGWRGGMNAVTRTLLGDCDGPTLELGCGRGDLLAALAADGANGPLVGIELHPEAFASSQPADVLFVRSDAHRLPCASASVATVLALDLLDQRGVEPAVVLGECRRVLQPGGRLVVRVSAYPWLYGPHDVAFNTARRFRRRELSGLLHEAGLMITRMTYADSLLIGPVTGLRLLQRWRVVSFDASLYCAQWSNGLIARTLNLEARFLARWNLPSGLSLFAVAQQVDD